MDRRLRRMIESVELWGFIPTFLDDTDPRPAAEQFAERYIGGWKPIEGFSLDIVTLELKFTDDTGSDPPMTPVSGMIFRNEVLLLYPSDWVVIVKDDESWEVSRMD